MNYIDLPPDATSIMESTRAIGYSLSTAIADIIDNSIAAQASRVEIFYSANDKYVAILDDGYGMSGEELNRAMKYGGISPLDTRNEKDLGRFGLGMKTASLSQCEVLTVVSKKNGRISARRWDLNLIRKINSWSLIKLSAEEIESIPRISLLEKFSSGTLVIWQELGRMLQVNHDIEKILPEKMTEVYNHLSLIFHRYLSGEEVLKKLSIFMNNLRVEPNDPFLTHKNTQAMPDDALLIEGYPPIKIVPFILPYPSKLSARDKKLLGITDDLQKNQGFYVYRSKRLIVWGTWFNRARKETLSQLARIQIDIPPAFDSLWTLDIKKSSAVPPTVVSRSLDAMIENLASKSKRTWRHRGKQETDKRFHHVWNRLKTRDNGIIYEVNENHPIFLRLIEKFPACEQNFKNLLKLIAASLPMNQLTLDLRGNEVEIKNSALYSENEARQILTVFIDGLLKNELNKFLDGLAKDDVFKNYPQLIEEFRRSDDND